MSPTVSPSVSPTTSNPSTSPSVSPTFSRPTASPSLSPTSSPTDDPCLVLTCSRDCNGVIVANSEDFSCGWDFETSLCRTGFVTTLEESQRLLETSPGDCSSHTVSPTISPTISPTGTTTTTTRTTTTTTSATSTTNTPYRFSGGDEAPLDSTVHLEISFSVTVPFNVPCLVIPTIPGYLGDGVSKSFVAVLHDNVIVLLANMFTGAADIQSAVVEGECDPQSASRARRQTLFDQVYNVNTILTYASAQQAAEDLSRARSLDGVFDLQFGLSQAVNGAANTTGVSSSAQPINEAAVSVTPATLSEREFDTSKDNTFLWVGLTFGLCVLLLISILLILWRHKYKNNKVQPTNSGIVSWEQRVHGKSSPPKMPTPSMHEDTVDPFAVLRSKAGADRRQSTPSDDPFEQLKIARKNFMDGGSPSHRSSPVKVKVKPATPRSDATIDPIKMHGSTIKVSSKRPSNPPIDKERRSSGQTSYTPTTNSPRKSIDNIDTSYTPLPGEVTSPFSKSPVTSPRKDSNRKRSSYISPYSQRKLSQQSGSSISIPDNRKSPASVQLYDELK